MTIYKFAPHGDDAKGTGSDLNPWRSFQKLGQVLLPGDEGLLADGEYPDDLILANSGTLAKPITVRGLSRGAVLLGMANLSDRSNVSLANLNLFSRQRGWVNSNDASGNLSFTQCAFDSENLGITPTNPRGTHFHFVGVILRGKGHVFALNRCGVWYGGNWMELHGSYHLVTGNDARYADNGHGLFVNHASHTIIQDNLERNSWARTSSLVSRDMSEKRRTVYQRNRVFASNYDGKVQAQGWSVTEEGPGDENITKVMNSETILRGNALIGLRIWPNLPRWNTYRAVLQLGNYDAYNTFARHIRIYHNTFFDCQQHLFAVTYNKNFKLYAEDVRIFNNIMHAVPVGPDGLQNHGLWINVAGVSNGPANGQTNYTWFGEAKWQVRHNLFANPIHYTGAAVTKGNTKTVAEFERMFPDLVSGNIPGRPSFTNPDYSAALADRDLFPTLEQFRLTSGSPGRAAAMPLARVEARDGDILRLSDAVAFSDGNGLVDGDDLVINGRTTRVLERLDGARLRVAATIPISTGDDVWLAEYGAYADMGAVGPVAAMPEPPIEVEPPVEEEPEPVPTPTEPAPELAAVRVRITIEVPRGSEVSVSVEQGGTDV